MTLPKSRQPGHRGGKSSDTFPGKDLSSASPEGFYQSLLDRSRPFTLLLPPASPSPSPTASRPRAVFSSDPLSLKEGAKPARQRHGVCTVQTFRNPVSGLKLFLFVRHYLALGYTVIVYDRFGAHREDLAPFLLTSSKFSGDSAGRTDGEVKYFPYTALQRAHPLKYSQTYAAKQVCIHLCHLPCAVCLNHCWRAGAWIQTLQRQVSAITGLCAHLTTSSV